MSPNIPAPNSSASELRAANFGLGSWPARRALLTPERIAWSFEGIDTSYAELELRVRKLGNALRTAGIHAGDRIAYLGFNHPALLEVLFAAGRIGAIAVIVNARLSPDEVGYILTDSGARMLCFGSEQTELAHTLQQRGASQQFVGIEAEDGTADWATDYEHLLQTGSLEDTPAAVELSDPCLIMYTSGTTGHPKGAVLSHNNMLFSGLNVLISTDIRPSDSCLAVAPLFHIAGLNGLVLPVFLRGGRIVIQRSFEPQAVVQALSFGQISCMFAVPTMLDAMASVPGFDQAEFAQLRTLIVGGAPVPARVLRQWNRKGVELQQGYGFTEAAPAVTLLSSENAISKEGSAGKPQFFMDVRVVTESGRTALPGQTGEILARGPSIMLGYWNNESATRNAFDGQWYRSGDIAEIDDDGFHYLRDRSKDLFISGGENVYPSEVESALLDLPGVRDAAVIGVPDERWGEVGKAFIVLEHGHTLDAEALRQQLLPRLAKYKIPKLFQESAALPRTATGKVQKHLLRTTNTTEGDH